MNLNKTLLLEITGNQHNINIAFIRI